MGYLVFAKTLREHVPNVFVFMFMVMLGGSCCVLLYLWISGEVFTFDRDISTGLWGWMNLRSDRLPLELWMVCICNLMGAMGYVRSMQYFDNLIIAVATLMEPGISIALEFAFLTSGKSKAHIVFCGLKRIQSWLPSWLIVLRLDCFLVGLDGLETS